MNFEEAIPVKKAVAVGMKRSFFIKKTQLLLPSKYPKKMKYINIGSYSK